MENFYKSFEDKFRGSKEEIKEKLKIYLPILKNHKNKKIVDLGCGRGEFLELLKEEGFNKLVGVDINKEMLKESSIKYEIDDALNFLKKQKDKSIGAIASFHMIEHMEFEKVLEIIKEAFRVLEDDGILILETPNPESLKVISENFWLDFTHKKPIPMQLLQFSVEYIGFKSKILRLNNNTIGNSIKDIIYSVSPDYAVIGYKKALPVGDEYLKKGVTLDITLFAFEERIKNIEKRLEKMDTKLQNEQLKSQIQQLNNQINQLNNQLAIAKSQQEHYKRLYEDVINSKSWKITKPLRQFMRFISKKKRNIILKITAPDKKEIKLSKRAQEIYEMLKKEIKGNK